MSNILKIEKPCTVIVKFSGSVNDSPWKVSTRSNVFHFRDIKDNLGEVKISFPFPGYFYSNKEIAEIKIVPLETRDIFDKIPKPERDYSPDSIYIEKVEGLTTTPARTWAKEGYMQTGEKFDELPSQVKFFILLHELGHQKFFTEWKTDLFALAHFLRLGYNESQAFYALTRVLNRNPDNVERIKKLYNIIINK